MPVVKFTSYVENVKLSAVKRVLLQEMWGADNSPFPKAWVRSSRLLALSGQKYFDRRLRELRDAAGLDIETRYMDGEHCWRIQSIDIGVLKARTYLTETEKKKLFEAAGYRCAVCGKPAVTGVRGLQADHKVPIDRGGGSELTNWQPLCNECNVAKRGVCQGCTLDCQTCTWAFPEKLGFNYVVKIPKELKERLDRRNVSLVSLEKDIVRYIEKIAK